MQKTISLFFLILIVSFVNVFGQNCTHTFGSPSPSITGGVAFHLFGDGYSSHNLNGVYQYEQGGNYSLESWRVGRYDPSLPFYSINPVNPLGCNISTPRPQKIMNGRHLKIGTSWNVAPDNIIFYTLTIENNYSSNVESGEITFHFNNNTFNLFPNDLIYDNYNHWFSRISINNSAQVFNETEVKWAFSNLHPGEQRHVYIPLETSSTIRKGDPYMIPYAVLYTERGKKIFSTPQQRPSTVAGNPHDPNIKTLINTGCLQMNSSEPKEQTLLYMIEFQNEGDGPTQYVEILDELSPYLDSNSVHIVDYSFPCSVSNLGNDVTFFFDDIYLPASNEPLPSWHSYDETKGYVIFEVCTDPEIEVGICIENTADIIFTDQAPITTNTTVICSFEDCEVYAPTCSKFRESPTEDRPIVSDSPSYKIHPNPAQDVAYLSLELPEDTEITAALINSHGRIAKSIFTAVAFEKGQHRQTISLENLSSGVYFLHLSFANETTIQRIVIVN